MPSRIALHPGPPLGHAVRVEVRLFQVHSFRRSCFSRWLRKEGFVRFVITITPLFHGPNCRCLPCPGRSHGQTGMSTISSRLVHLSGTGLLLIIRAVVASPFAIKMCSQDFIRKPTNIPGSILSSAFVRFVNGPTRYHTLSPNTHLPMWCPRPRHRSNGTFPSGRTVSRFSKVVACTIIQAMVFDSGGICIWQLNSSSFLSVLTMPPTSPTALSARPFPA